MTPELDGIEKDDTCIMCAGLGIFDDSTACDECGGSGESER